MNESPPETQRPQRIFLRIPVRLKAGLFFVGKLQKNILITDLSSGGCSFFVEGTEELPAMFEIRFRLSRFSKQISATTDLKNETQAPGGRRVGCVFTEISGPDQQLINTFITQLADFSFADNIIFSAIFFCIIDSLWRAGIYVLSGYYSMTAFGRDAQVFNTPFFYSATVICYVTVSFTAGAVTSRIIPVKGRKRFVLSIAFLAALLVYLLWKTVSYIRQGLWNVGYPLVKALLWWDVLTVLYVGITIAASLIMLKKITFILGLIRQHSEREEVHA